MKKKKKRDENARSGAVLRFLDAYDRDARWAVISSGNARPSAIFSAGRYMLVVRQPSVTERRQYSAPILGGAFDAR